MEIVEIPVPGYEKVVRAEEPAKGYCAIIAVHDTTLGPSLGGLRMWKYKSREDAQTDVLRLARGMTYKSAIARTGLGGGKAVLLADAQADKSDELFQWVGRFIDRLEGKYITAEDVGINVYDLDVLARETRFVAGRSREVGGSGDPSPYTALGAFLALKASLKETFGSADPAGRTVAIQGLGHVGYWFAKHLHEAGAKLLVSDIHGSRTDRAAQEFNAQVLGLNDIYAADCDVFAPCAMGAILNDKTIPTLRCRVICGAANNQLAELRHAAELPRRGIHHAPDSVVNAGGIINISVELTPGGYDEEVARTHIEEIVHALEDIYAFARSRKVTTAQAANAVAERVLEEGHRQKTVAG